MMKNLLAPEPSNATETFWKHTERGELAIPYCPDCEDYFYFPRNHCPVCMAEDYEHRVSDGRAELVSYSTLHRAPTKAYQEQTPYTCAIVRLVEEDVRLFTTLDIEDQDDAEIGMALEVSFQETEGDIQLPFFAPV